MPKEVDLCKDRKGCSDVREVSTDRGMGPAAAKIFFLFISLLRRTTA